MRPQTGACVLLVALAASLHAGEEQPMPPNAALKYWQAATLLPDDTDNKQAKLFARPELPETAEFVRSCGQALMFLHQGAAIRRSDWGVAYELGMEMPLPHLAKMRRLARAAVISAQYEFGRKDYKAGVERAFDILALARHAGGGNLLIGRLVEVAITSMAVDVLASNLPGCPPEVLDTIPARFPCLRPSALVDEVVSADQRVLAESFRSLFRKGDVDHFPDIMAGVVGNGELKPEDRARAEAFWKGLFGNEAKLDAVFNEMGQLNNELAAIMASPGRQHEAALAGLDEKIKAANLVARLVLPVYIRSWRSVAASDVRQRLLESAADVVRSGPQAIAKHKDPFGDGPFVYIKRGAGFELQSALPGQNDQKVKLSVGEPQQPRLDQADQRPVKPPAP
ncbi:MAG: hypothetical protein ABSE73_07690, partial [Planctomycetota bacterium]